MGLVKNLGFLDRKKSFMILGVIYAAEALLCILLFRLLPFYPWVNLLIANTVGTAFLYAGSAVFQNSSVFDPYWSVQPIIIVTATIIGRAWRPAGWLLLLAVWIWGLRLTANWAMNFHGLMHEDWRYTQLRERYRALFPFINFFGIHMMPAFVVYACVLPAMLVINDGKGGNTGSIIFFFVALAAVLIEGLADLQMFTFRMKKRQGFINYGLWKYSRHPNYFGEICFWWTVWFSMLCAAPYYAYLIFGPMALTAMFLFISIPMADRKQAKKPGFEAYKSRTWMLLPIPKK